MPAPGAERLGDGDLAEEALAAALGGRPFRTYPAVVSTEADAMAWARAGGPHGGVVVAGYQAAPRGRAGFPWSIPPAGALACSVVLRPDLEADREGWLYSVGVAALGDVCGGNWTYEWPDTLWEGGRGLGSVCIFADLAGSGVRWAVMSLLVRQAPAPRGPVLSRLVDAVDERCEQAAADLRAGLRGRCRTVGQTVRARLVPLGPRGIVVTGVATDLDDDGSLVVAGDTGRRVPVRPQDVGILERA